MDKRTTKITKLIKRFHRKYQAKRRVKNFNLVAGLVFEICRSRWSVKESVRIVNKLEKTYVDWNEFRVTGLKTLQKDLGLSVKDLQFLAYLKQVMQQFFTVLGSFDEERFHELPVTECLELLDEVGIDEELGATVLVTYLDRNILPLPEGVLRFIKRFNMFPNKTSRKRIRTFFMKLGEEGTIDLYQTFRLFQHHADTVCHLKEPDCAHCFVAKDCPSAVK